MNCSYGKKEMKKEADSYTNFGTVLDLEPPEPVLSCKKCVRDEIAFWLELGVMPLPEPPNADDYILQETK